ncbi:hypothetical protein J502_0529 [Acinetobacter sp. 1294596]|nr:hypothetical protein J502_0529 [Acinetobacter sp. 1294596]
MWNNCDSFNMNHKLNYMNVNMGHQKSCKINQATAMTMPVFP